VENHDNWYDCCISSLHNNPTNKQINPWLWMQQTNKSMAMDAANTLVVSSDVHNDLH
jgi:hypothetical protein